MIKHNTKRLKLSLPRLIKRGIDVALAGTALLLLSPVLAIVAWVARRDGGPAFFVQKRVGQAGRLFLCYKFRSMHTEADAFLARYLKENAQAAEEWKQNRKLKNDVRITKFGHFIRRASLDELPQLLNVLKGDMSLVGPRPITLDEVEKYDDDIAYYYSVRPGLTGPWQISGRNNLSYAERVDMDGRYVRNWSLWRDMAIVCKTIPAVLKREGAY
ncbi:MAG: sugar transferase [Alphaproteobacteria bacterium]|nr:sugar transferase [Alphaproteobacteria bacterium]